MADSGFNSAANRGYLQKGGGHYVVAGRVRGGSAEARAALVRAGRYCAPHSRFFWGFRLYLITTAEGMPVIWGLTHPRIGEHEVTQALPASPPASSPRPPRSGTTGATPARPSSAPLPRTPTEDQ